ncbi:hypothetical protein J0B03_10650 [Alkalibacter rhizosphaerae]|uniref:Polymer-forming cytoskeletal protein n=1 Tax=Alkalibacter rhizosphaerae TaxID=2815577 RepID=A0A974XEJ6_9FIRM|nr:hypothetical protein [Alkalibacter rhizosphaerae]QSX08241.1 hypothetical protein J0B03_10650 [Alkalibacter rhizosphaerae]
MKFKSLIVLLALSLVLFAGCGSSDNGDDNTDGGNDTVTAASLVEDAAVLEASIGADGKWIVCTLNDVETDKELVIEGDFYNKDDATSNLYRKLALYAQDADHKVTDRYTLKAPKLTVKSPNTKIQGGTFVGDVYVESEGFKLTDATIDGDVYFASSELANAFTVENGGKVTGKIVVDGADVVTTASLLIDDTAFIDAIGTEGTWIIAALNNITTKQELVLEGDFYDKDDTSLELYRKIALYAQDADRNVTARYTLTAPSLTIKSPNSKIQGGTFVGDVYVETTNFKLTDAKIEGNLYFANQEMMDSFVNEKESTITGETAVKTK